MHNTFIETPEDLYDAMLQLFVWGVFSLSHSLALVLAFVAHTPSVSRVVSLTSCSLAWLFFNFVSASP